MGRRVRDKHLANRRPRSIKSDSDLQHLHHFMHPCCNCNGNHCDNICNMSMGNSDSSISSFDDSGSDYCTEEQLEEILLKNLDMLYNEAIFRLKALGYDEEASLKAVLRNGHYYGGMDILANVLKNSLEYLSNERGAVPDEPELVFTDLKQLEDFSLASMVCLLQQVKPHLSRGETMWCLLMSDLHLGRATIMDMPVFQPPKGSACCSESGSGIVSANVGVTNSDKVGAAQSICRFHGGRGFGSRGTSEFPTDAFFSSAVNKASQSEIECPKMFNISPSMKKMLKRNVAVLAAGFRANLNRSQNQSESHVGSFSIQAPVEEPQTPENIDAFKTILRKFRDLNIEGDAEHVTINQKDEMIFSLIQQIKDLEKTVEERKDWAHEKAMQAARKLSHDLTELKLLRIEKEETQRLKNGKQNLDGSTMKKISDMENALRKESARVDRSNAAVRKLGTENAEMRAEMEASKLSASESVKACLEVAKREKKCLKRLLAWEKQKSKLQEEICKEKQKISDLQKELLEVEDAQKEAEAKWRLEQNAKEQALGQLDEEQRLKEAAEPDSKRRVEALRLKIGIDSQRHKDDLQRLEQELSRLRASVQSAETHPQSTYTVNSRDIISQHEINELEDSPEKESSWERDCLICMTDEVSIVFLPCAHLVLCANCNDGYGRKGKATCPCCRVPIEERIRVFGATS